MKRAISASVGSLGTAIARALGEMKDDMAAMGLLCARDFCRVARLVITEETDKELGKICVVERVGEVVMKQNKESSNGWRGRQQARASVHSPWVHAFTSA